MQRDSDSLVLKAIEQNDMIFVSAQPDTTYFHWQVELYLYQFSKHGISNRCYALFGYKGNAPTDYAKRLGTKYPGIKFYRDERTYNDYAPTIRPHILAKFFKEYPHLGKNVFYHDSDIFLVKLPRFDLMLQPYDSTAYLSDTISYIGYEYIKNCSNRYKTKYSQLRDLDIFYGMCESINVDPVLVQQNQQNSGGAQYLLKNIDYQFWEKCEKGCEKLYSFLCSYEKKYPISDHIQKWTADMWVVLWFYWRDIGPTVIHKELDFSWATGTVKDYNTMNIFHLAGITGSNSSDKFQKGNYTKNIVFESYFKNPRVFDFINKNNATYEYTNVIKEYTKNVYIPEYSRNRLGNNTKTINYKDKRSIDQIVKTSGQLQPSQSSLSDNVLHNVQQNVQQNISQFVPYSVTQAVQSQSIRPNDQNVVRKFKMATKDVYNGVYTMSVDKLCCGKNIWRSYNGKFIIFWTGKSWVLTYSHYERNIGPLCGGIISTLAEMPYMGGWNVKNLNIDILKN
jgi:hypothetical protein